MKKNSARLSEEPGTHRERQSIEDYSKVLKKLKKLGAIKDKAMRNLVNNLEIDSKFMKNQDNVPNSRKSQCRRQPSQSKMNEANENQDKILTISPTFLEKAQKYRGTSSVKRGGRKYSQGDYDSINSLQKSEIDSSKNNSNVKIQLK